MFASLLSTHGKEFTSEMQVKVMGRTDADGAKIVVQELELPLTPSDFLLQFRRKSDEMVQNCPLMPGI